MCWLVTYQNLSVIANKIATQPQNPGSRIKTELMKREGFLISVL